MEKIIFSYFQSTRLVKSDVVLVKDVPNLAIEKDTLSVIQILLSHSTDFEISVRMDDLINRIVVKPAK